MHVILDQDAAQNLIVDLNKSYSGLNVGATVEYSFKNLWNYLGFDLFRKQLRAFLRNHQLPTEICDDRTWKEFLRYSTRVIQDCPLVCSRQGAVGDLRFDKLVLAASMGENGTGVPGQIKIRWQAYFRNNKVADFGFSPGAGALVARKLLPKQ